MTVLKRRFAKRIRNNLNIDLVIAANNPRCKPTVTVYVLLSSCLYKWYDSVLFGQSCR